MRTRVNRRLGSVLALAVAVAVLHAERATADPLTVSGFLEGQPRIFHLLEELTLTFPDFNVVLSDVTHLNPNFCFECGTGAPVPFTQSTGSFSGHSVANPALHTIDADVSGNLSFVGPTDVLDISHDPPAGDVLTSRSNGPLATITQPNGVLFNGTWAVRRWPCQLETNPTGVTRLAGYHPRSTVLRRPRSPPRSTRSPREPRGRGQRRKASDPFSSNRCGPDADSSAVIGPSTQLGCHDT